VIKLADINNENNNIKANEEGINKDTLVLVDVSSDKMSAFITLFAPEYGQSHTVEGILEALKSYGVTFGVDREIIELAVKQNIFYKKIIAAKGLSPVNGKDGQVQFQFDLNKNYKPIILENGKVDFRDLGLIESVRKGQVLCALVPPTQGIGGRDVLNSEIPAYEGKTARLPVGKNVEILNDSNSLIASVDGQVSYSNGKISVYTSYEIKGDVDNSTGNINFVGNVIVRGNVLSGFSVVAGGNIEIWGIVEGAEVISEGNIVIRRGVQGNNKAYIKSNGDIVAKFIEQSKVEAMNDIKAETIMHSSVKCGGSLELGGRIGLLVGGSSAVCKELYAKVIGSQMATLTEIEIGVNSDLRDAVMNIKSEINSIQNSLQKTEQVISILSKLESNNMLTEDKKGIYEKSLFTRDFYKSKLSQLNYDIEQIEKMISMQSAGKLRCLGSIHPGVKVTIGSSTMYIKEELKYCTLFCDGVDIKVSPFV